MPGFKIPFAAFLLTLLVCVPVRADPAFQTHYQLGAALYQAQRYDEAIAEFQAAYQMEAKPGLLFNIAQAYRKSGKPREAIEYYDRYLQAAPQLDGDTRHKVDGYLSEARNTLAALELELKRRMAEDKAGREKEGKATPSEPEPELAKNPNPPLLSPAPDLSAASAPRPPEPRPIYRRWWFWTAIGGVVAAGVVGAVVGTQVHGGPTVPDYPRGTLIF